ncbi:MAG: hypothetical protein ACREQV_03165 [Candidatus Binatia bacterium]
MNRPFIKLAAVFLCAVMFTASAKLYAIDANNRYFAYGLGQRPCEDYVKFREKRLDTLARQYERFTKDELYEVVDKVVEHWIAGFITAHNLYVSDTYDVVGQLSMNDLEARLEKECRANTRQYFAQAMIKLVQELHPQRVKAEPRK